MYNIFYCNLFKISNKLLDAELNTLPRFIQEQIKEKQNEDDRRRSLAGYMLARRYTAAFCNKKPEEIEFDFGEHGKPFVINGRVHYNISHCQNYVVLAVSEQPIGVDIEIVREFSALLAQKKFTEQEVEYIAAAGREGRSMQQAFYEIWTAKEAYLKFTGAGISGGLNALTLTAQNSRLYPENRAITLTYDQSIPGAVIAVVQNSDN